MTSTLFGSAPKANFSTQPTIAPAQNDILNALSDILANPSGFTRQEGQGVGNTSLGALEEQALAVPRGLTAEQNSLNTASNKAVTNALSYAAPTVSADKVSADKISAPTIDATKSFQKGVVQPLTDDFLARTLPGIAGKYGGSAGGAYSSGSMEARRQAGTDLERTLAQSGSQYAFAADTANQKYAFDTAASNQTADLTAGIANQRTGLQAGVANQGASIDSQKAILTALGLAPTTASMPATELGGDIALSTSTFGSFNDLIKDMIAGYSGQTQSTSAVGTGGSSGILGGLLGAAGSGGSSSLASSFGSWLFSSDRRLKEDVEEVGSVDGFPLYKFKYKGRPERHLGLIAQDVEKRLPHAVVDDARGYKMIDYAAVIENALREAA